MLICNTALEAPSLLLIYSSKQVANLKAKNCHASFKFWLQYTTATVSWGFELYLVWLETSVLLNKNYPTDIKIIVNLKKTYKT